MIKEYTRDTMQDLVTSRYTGIGRVVDPHPDRRQIYAVFKRGQITSFWESYVEAVIAVGRAV